MVDTVYHNGMLYAYEKEQMCAYSRTTNTEKYVRKGKWAELTNGGL